MGSRTFASCRRRDFRDAQEPDRGYRRSLVRPPTWSLFGISSPLHPLGGCQMGASADSGVVVHLGEVFGYPNLIVADGAIVPTSTGRNPSHTIAALAERIAAHIS